MSWKVDAQAFRRICTLAFRSHTAVGERQMPPGRILQRGEDAGLLRKGMSGPALTGQGWSLGGWGRAPDPHTAGWQLPEHAT